MRPITRTIGSHLSKRRLQKCSLDVTGCGRGRRPRPLDARTIPSSIARPPIRDVLLARARDLSTAASCALVHSSQPPGRGVSRLPEVPARHSFAARKLRVQCSCQSGALYQFTTPCNAEGVCSSRGIADEKIARHSDDKSDNNNSGSNDNNRIALALFYFLDLMLRIAKKFLELSSWWQRIESGLSITHHLCV